MRPSTTSLTEVDLADMEANPTLPRWQAHARTELKKHGFLDMYVHLGRHHPDLAQGIPQGRPGWSGWAGLARP